MESYTWLNAVFERKKYVLVFSRLQSEISRSRKARNGLEIKNDGARRPVGSARQENNTRWYECYLVILSFSADGTDSEKAQLLVLSSKATRVTFLTEFSYPTEYCRHPRTKLGAARILLLRVLSNQVGPAGPLTRGSVTATNSCSRQNGHTKPRELICSS